MASAERIPANGYDLLDTMTGLRAYLNAQRKFEMDQYDAIHEGAMRLKKNLESLCRAQNRTNRKGIGMITPEQKMAIRRIVKPFQQAADLHMASERNLALVYSNIMAMFPPTPPKKQGKQFDPNK